MARAGRPGEWRSAPPIRALPTEKRKPLRGKESRVETFWESLFLVRGDDSRPPEGPG